MALNITGPTTASAVTNVPAGSIASINVQAAINELATDLTAISGAQYLGTAAVKAISYNAQNISENITIPGTVNAMSVGPIIISDGFTVVVEDGATWIIL